MSGNYNDRLGDFCNLMGDYKYDSNKQNLAIKKIIEWFNTEVPEYLRNTGHRSLVYWLDEFKEEFWSIDYVFLILCEFIDWKDENEQYYFGLSNR